MILTKAAAQGLRRLAGLDGGVKASPATLAACREAIGWAMGLRPGRQIVLVLSPAEALELEGTYRHALAPGSLNMPATRLGRQALLKLSKALDADRPGRRRLERFEQPAEAIGPADDAYFKSGSRYPGQ